MALSECIAGLIKDGLISKAKGSEAEVLYDRHFQRLKRSKGMMAAASEASDLTIAKLKGDAAAARRGKISTAMAQVRALEDMKTYAGGVMQDGLIDPRSATALAVWDDRARYMDLEAQHEAVRATYHATLDAGLKANRATMLGRVRDPALEEDILAAAYGEKVDSINAREIAENAQKVAELARQQFNEGGGHIGKIDDWHWVQDHSGEKFMAAGYDGWKAMVTGADERGVPILKLASMIDHETGLPFEPEGESFDRALRQMYQNVTTDGRATMGIGQPKGAALYNRHAEERFFVFSDSKTHLAYAAQFGKSGVWQGMMHHLDRMARDVAAIQRFGANPDATIRFVGDTLIQQAAERVGFKPYVKAKLLKNPIEFARQKLRPDPQDRAHSAAKELQASYDVFMGKHDLQIPRSRKVAAGFDAFRSWEGSAKLGGAFWSATTGDKATAAVTRSFNGLGHQGWLTDYLKLLAPTENSLEHRQMLIRHGALAADWAHSGAQAQRQMGEEFQGELSRRLAELTIRASGLSKHTDIERQLFVQHFNAGIADNVHLPFDKLNPKLAKGLDNYGIGAAEWDKLRATPLEPAHGTVWFNPMAIEDGALRDRYLRMVHTEKRFAVPEADLRTRTMLNSNFQRGTVFGEAMKSLFLFKGFGLILGNTHGRRALSMGGMAGLKQGAVGIGAPMLAYALRMSVFSMVAGAVAIQIHNLLRGNDPEPMDSAAFAGAAEAQGGGWGIFGDFLKQSDNRFGGGIATTIAGPGGQTVQNVLDLTWGNMSRANKGEKVNVGRDIVKIMRQEVPVASSLWYLRPAYDRLLIHEMDAMINPDHDAAEARAIQRADRAGAAYFAPPGSGMSSWRAPDWGNAIGQPSVPENVAAREAALAKADAPAAP